MLTIYNSLTQTKQPFVSLQHKRVRMYVCGMTVYDFCHLGHARGMVFFDTVVRYLRYCGFEVQYVRNITDIDDKIIQRAAENHISVEDLTKRFITAMNEDAERLSVLAPDQEPKATEHIPQIILMIQKLLDRKHAYIGANRDIYFDISSFPEYGILSSKKLEELEPGARIDIVTEKRNPLDFVLWKSAKTNEPHWSSPWGDGRPGWHIECSAMSTHCLGERFDIHGGGQDLQFPHHENEIAQSVCANGESFAQFWMHHGLIRINDFKMSKSLNNYVTVREILMKFQAETVRFFLLSSHYRSPLHYSVENLLAAHHSLSRLYIALRRVPRRESSIGIDSKIMAKFKTYMDEDFNTPKVIALLHDTAHKLNRADAESRDIHVLANTLVELGGIIGILQDSVDKFLQANIDDIELVEQLIARRTEAKQTQDYVLADKIRDQLKQMNISIEDTKQGTLWRRD